MVKSLAPTVKSGRKREAKQAVQQAQVTLELSKGIVDWA